jgi:nicotinate phosphoribosyltransferase
MLFDDELQAFQTFARAMPGNCVFLVDTYDTLDGVRHAIEVGKWLRSQGKPLLGVRIDSGDLAWLSNEARRLLDEAGFRDARIYATNELDEHVIQSLKQQGAAIGVWGVGTRLVTGHDDPALGGVYKLSMVREPSGAWQPRIKLSEQAAKISTPGILQVRRFSGPSGAVADMIYDEELGPSTRLLIDPVDLTRRRTVEPGAPFQDLLAPVVKNGARVQPAESLEQIRARAAEQLGQFHPAIKRFLNPHVFPVGLESKLHERRTRLVLAARGHAHGGNHPG